MNRFAITLFTFFFSFLSHMHYLEALQPFQESFQGANSVVANSQNQLYSYSRSRPARKSTKELMNRIFSLHFQEKKMTKQTILRSLSLYINSFDPMGDYLLRREREKWINPSSEVVDKIMQEYFYNKFSYYSQMDKEIRKSIERARSLRSLWLSEADLFFSALKKELSDPSSHFIHSGKPGKQGIVDSLFALQEKQKKSMLAFFRMQIEKIGYLPGQEEQKKIISLYEKKMQSYEDRFLYEKEGKHSMQQLYILKSLTGALDAHTTFFHQEEAKRIRMSLEKEFQGIGAVLEEGINGVQITKLIEGGGAEDSGKLQQGDWIIAIDHREVTSLSFLEVIKRLQGDPGSTVLLTVKRLSRDIAAKTEELKRAPSIFEVPVQRKRIALKEEGIHSSFENFGDGIIGKIRLDSFYENGEVSSEKDIIQAIRSFRSQGKLKGLVLDLRENPGGFLGQAVKVAGLFLSSGVVAVAKYGDESQHVFRDIDGYRHFDGPIVILISKTSASAAEIVSQALQDYGVAVVIGSDHSFGKGSIQQQNLTKKGASHYFKVTVGKFYTASGRTTQIHGVKADISIPGIWFHEQVGEKFLSYPLPTDRLSPYYYDSLEDISPDHQEWFVKNYLSYLQAPQSFWIEALPMLQEKSHQRIVNNDIFTRFLSLQRGELVRRELHKKLIREQEKEAVQILKDMIFLQEKKRSHFPSRN